MFRIMVVDDEPLILAGIISMVNWEEHQCKIVGKATNGKQALEKIEELSPDIIITDIKMPAMDGIELIKKAKEQYSDAIFIILTNLEGFKLVKKAMSLGAIDYLVKLELTDEILLSTVQRAISICQKNRKLKSSYEDNKITKISVDEMILNYFQKLLVYNTDDNEIKDIPECIAENFKEPIVMMINFNYKTQTFFDKVNRDEQKRMISYAENILNEMVKRFFYDSCIVRGKENTLILIISTYKVDEYSALIQSMGEKMIAILKDYFEVSVFISVSKKGNLVSEVINLYYQAITAMNYYYYDYSNQIIFYSEEYEKIQEISTNINISLFKKELSSAIRHNDSKEFKEIINKFIEILRKNKLSKVRVINTCSNIYYFVMSFYEQDEEKKLLYEININEVLQKFRSLNNIIDWTIGFRNEIVEIIERKKVNKSDKIIKMVEEYVKKNYKDKIFLSKVADDFNISSGYLSSVFKKQTGSTFSDYVSEVKVEKAKELIATNEYMMYEVSEILGFDNPYYFSKVFKKVTGHTPKEYEVVYLRKKGESVGYMSELSSDKIN